MDLTVLVLEKFFIMAMHPLSLTTLATRTMISRTRGQNLKKFQKSLQTVEPVCWSIAHFHIQSIQGTDRGRDVNVRTSVLKMVLL